VAVSVSPQGDPHITAWATAAAEWALFWYSPPMASELILVLGPNVLFSEAQHQVIFVSGADAENPQGKPHVFVTRSQGNGMELVYATRSGPGKWTISPIDQALAGESVLPLAVVGEPGGSVRLIYTKRLGLSQPEILMHWIDKGQSGTALLASSTGAMGATVARDGFGGFHVALYEFTGVSDYSVRYLRFGP
jgi:hypothetical protein